MEDGVFFWTSLLVPSFLMVWQPPVRPLDEKPLTVEDEIQAESMGLKLNGGEPVVAPTHDPMVCPSCKRPLPQAKVNRPPEPKRPRRTWSVTVPKDEREDGAELLDGLLEQSREAMGRLGLPYGEENSVKYFVLAASLGLFVLHADELMGDS